MTTTYYALIDVGTSALLTLHTDSTTINFLEKISADTLSVPYVQSPHYSTNYFFGHRGSRFLSHMRPGDYPLWTWDKPTRSFIPTRPDVITETLRMRSALATVKGHAFGLISKDISLARMRTWGGVMFQDTVYIIKRIQAQACKDSGYDELRSFEWPFVVMSADESNVDLKTAADEILLKAAMNDEILARTEQIRLHAMNRLKQTRDPNEIPEILKETSRMCWSYNLY